MSYYYSKTVKGLSFDQAIEKATEALQVEGFGVLTQIPVNEVLKKKLDVDFKPYRILGACNPHFAYKALSSEDKIGVFLPCNVVVSQESDGTITLTAVDPVASMMSVSNPSLADIAGEVKDKLRRAIDAI